MNRSLYALIAIAALVPITAAAAASPTPSPTLDQVLAAPPSGFAELTSATFHGEFTAHDYATNTSSAKASQIESTLIQDGFVDGYGKSWIQQSANHALVEAVIAFTGGKGAHDWLTQAEAGDKSDPTYVHSDSITGIASYYGGHFSYSTSATVGDVFVFVKGNDVFLIGAVSQKDDVLSLATSQTTSQYNAAPESTIPSAQWPENQTTSGASAAGFGAAFFILAALVVVAVVVLALVLRSRRRAPAAAVYGAAMYGQPEAPAMGSVPMAPPVGVQLSDDGRYWWDGQTWKDATLEAPPSAQRSSDGTLWWDGRNWRPVPQSSTSWPGPPPAG